MFKLLRSSRPHPRTRDDKLSRSKVLQLLGRLRRRFRSQADEILHPQISDALVDQGDEPHCANVDPPLLVDALDLLGKSGEIECFHAGKAGKMTATIYSLVDTTDISWVYIALVKFPDGRIERCAAKFLFLKDCDAETHFQMSEREHAIWRGLNHKHILQFYGQVAVTPEHVLFISPWMEKGNLIQYFKHHHNASESHRLALIEQGIKGFAYLHESGIVHGDIKPQNLFISNTGEAVVADFGLARDVVNNSLDVTTVGIRSMGSKRYLSPEHLHALQAEDALPLPKTKSADVFSLGGLMYFALSNVEPWAGMIDPRAISKAYQMGALPDPPLPTKFRRAIREAQWVLIVDAWDFDPVKRPTMQAVLERIQTEHSTLQGCL